MGANIGNTCQLQQTLHGAVLAVFAVQNREHNIDLLAAHTAFIKDQQTVSPHGRDHCGTIIRAVFPSATGQQAIVIAAEEDPLTLTGNAHGEDLIFLCIHIVQHRFCRTQGHRVFRADTAKQNAYIQSFHFHRLIFTNFS